RHRAAGRRPGQGREGAGRHRPPARPVREGQLRPAPAGPAELRPGVEYGAPGNRRCGGDDRSGSQAAELEVNAERGTNQTRNAEGGTRNQTNAEGGTRNAEPNKRGTRKAERGTS